MLVDAANLYFRAFYAVPDSITGPNGRPSNAIRGFLDMSAMLIERRRPTRWTACLDLSWRPEFRIALIPSYKAHRAEPDGSEQIPPKLAEQIPPLLDILGALGLACAGADGFEADDVMATLAARDAETVEVVSGDRDMLALATERVTVLYAGRGIGKLEIMRPADVAGKYGVPAENYADFAILRGDPSDGLPGVAGVGEKTAAALVSRFGPIEAIVAAATSGDDGFPAGAAAKIRAAVAYLAVAPDAVRPRLDVPIPDLRDELPTEPRDPERLEGLVTAYGVESAAGRLRRACAAAVR
jgi:5'-3' exonuclease